MLQAWHNMEVTVKVLSIVGTFGAAFFIFSVIQRWARK